MRQCNGRSIRSWISQRGHKLMVGLIGLAALTAMIATPALVVTPAWAAGEEGNLPAGNPAPQGSGESQALVLTLQQAIARALEVAPELRLAALDVAEKEIALKEAEIGQLEGRPASELAAAQFELEKAKQAMADARESVALSVEQQYYQVLRSTELLDIQRQSLERAEKQFKVTEARYQAGLISRQDYLTAQDQLVEQQHSFHQAQASLDLAKLQFKFLLGLPQDQEIILQDRFPFAPLEVDLAQSLNQALARRSDLLAARRAVANAEKQVALSDNDYTPPVELRKAKMALERAQIAAAQAEIRVILDVRQKYLALEQAKTAVEDSVRARERARDALRIAEARYNNGLSPLLELLNAQTALAQAELDAVGAVWDYNLAKAAFLQAIGERLLPEGPHER
ncbi:MAG TPA: TolC family protein [Firmicutes bacterium]|nr:TolC family protein [Bacillota bacterium]